MSIPCHNTHQANWTFWPGNLSLKLCDNKTETVDRFPLKQLQPDSCVALGPTFLSILPTTSFLTNKLHLLLMQVIAHFYCLQPEISGTGKDPGKELWMSWALLTS